MIGLLQRVSRATVRVDDQQIAAIGPGILALVAVERTDSEAHAARLANRILAYRLFQDDQGRMNRSLRDTGNGLLLVPQFTLAADTNSGNRPSFSGSAPPELGEQLFDHLVDIAREAHPTVAVGRFGANMAVELVNDGPVTFWLRVP